MQYSFLSPPPPPSSSPPPPPSSSPPPTILTALPSTGDGGGSGIITRITATTFAVAAAVATTFAAAMATTTPTTGTKARSSKTIIPSPSSIGFTIYTRSGCEFCKRAKKLLLGKNAVIVECDDFILEDNKKKAFWSYLSGAAGIPSTHRTFPVIFYKSKFIGGYSEAVEYFSNK